MILARPIALLMSMRRYLPTEIPWDRVLRQCRSAHFVALAASPICLTRSACAGVEC